MDRVALVRSKLDRAKQHLRDLDAAVRAFLDAKPYVVSARRDPATRRPTYYLASVADPPVQLSSIAGDVLHNLRSALDHLAHQLVMVAGHDPPSDHVYFPISGSAKQYRNDSRGKVKGMRDAAIKAIDALTPYKGGNDRLWQLHRLEIVDKHRTLLVVGSAFRAVNIAPTLGRGLEDFWKQAGVTDPPRVPDLWLRPADRMFPLVAGEELFRDAPDAEVQNIPFRFDVAIGEPGIIEGEPLMETLQQMTKIVEQVVDTLAPHLA